ncbi:MAG: MBL fold metallo-hydrolase [Pseudomonadota bacterium]
MVSRHILAALAASLTLVLPAVAQEEARPPSHCIALVENTPGLAVIQPASYLEPLEDFTVRLSYVDHSMFLLQTPGGVSAVTDYNGFVGQTALVPDVVTMNHAHSSHWTALPDPEIPHVLKGWGVTEPAEHYVEIGDLLVRNVTTDIRSAWTGGVEENGNSIFIFEVEGLCIGHLGHLHHMPSDAQFAAIGRLDVVMAPVDGGMTLPLPEMIATLKRLRSSIVIPMHWFSGAGLGVFLEGMSDEFRIEVTGDTALEVSLRDLPSEPKVVVLRPRFLGWDETPAPASPPENPAID